MPTKTEEIIKEVSNTFQVSTDQILQQSLTAFLEHRLRTVEAEVFEITGRYGVTSVEEMEARYSRGFVRRSGELAGFSAVGPLGI